LSKTKQKEAVEIFAIIDRSGSMRPLTAEAIGGFNAFLAEQKAVKGKANLTLVLFDHEYLVVEDQTDIQDVKELTLETYVPRGMTALNDALGMSLVKLEEINPKKAIICVLTDGAENSSKEFTGLQVKELMTKAEDKGYQTVFLAANIDANLVSKSLGVTRGVVQGFGADADGMHTAYATMGLCASAYRA
jgi:Mg-chelatase subunit ChlD